MLFKFNQSFSPFENDFCTLFLFLRAGDCEAYFFAVRKNMWRQAWRTSVRSLVHLGQEKVSVAPDIFWLIKWIRPSVRFDGQATAIRSHGVNFGRRDQKRALPCSMQWRFLFWHRQKRRKRYFCKSNKTPPLVSARNHKNCSDLRRWEIRRE